jgi:hypothetical protein
MAQEGGTYQADHGNLCANVSSSPSLSQSSSRRQYLIPQDQHFTSFIYTK